MDFYYELKTREAFYLSCLIVNYILYRNIPKEYNTIMQKIQNAIFLNYYLYSSG